MAFDNEMFALNNPICVITGKEKKDLTRDDLIKVILEKQIERITFHYTAIDGRIRELRIPITNRKQAEHLLTNGERVDGSSLFKGMVDTGKSDLYVVPVYSSAFLNPFDCHSLDFVCRFFDKDGNLADFAPDNILHNANMLLKKTSGLDLHALGELEFYLIGNVENNTYPLPRQKGYHGSAPFVKTGDVLNEALRHVSQIIGNVKYAHYEVGSILKLESDYEELNGKTAEQVEIEFLPTPIEETADIMVIASWIVRNVAYKHNFVATFYPKLDIGDAGSGLHFHTMLRNGEKNMMTDDKGNLSEEAHKLIGGFCKYAPSLTAFGNMVSGSYLRLVPGQEAPTRVCWSESNRSAMIRVPLAWTKISNLAQKINPQQTEPLANGDSKQTVEIRTPDGSANVHLLLAGLCMATEWGFRHGKEALKLAEKNHVTVNINDPSFKGELAELPACCVDSADVLIESKDLYERENIFPEKVIKSVAKALSAENDKNLNSRLTAMNEDERKYESRRIMHRHIHICK